LDFLLWVRILQDHIGCLPRQIQQNHVSTPWRILGVGYNHIEALEFAFRVVQEFAMNAFDLSAIPFSLAGSFLAISPNGCRLLYRTTSARAVRRRAQPFEAADFFEIALTVRGEEVPYAWSAAPHRLDLIAAGDGFATLVFADPRTLLFKTSGVGLRLLPAKPFDACWQPAPDQLALLDFPARGLHQLRCAPGASLAFHPVPAPGGAGPSVAVDFSGPAGAQGALRFAPHEQSWPEPLPDIDETLALREREYQQWQARMPRVPAAYQAAAEQAWFLLWNSQVPASSPLTRPAVYMSKSWMNAIWAWDNCFNALALARADPALAWDQLLLFFDQPDPNGMVPDCINDLEALYGFTKPPVQGWAIRKLIHKLGLKTCLPYLAQIYKPLARLTEWWYTLRDSDQDGLPHYHHGNDSGWDNATVFDQGCPTAGADLAAYLVLQCETLAMIARTLGKPKAAARWLERAEGQLKRLLEHGWHDGAFQSPLAGQLTAAPSQSLLNFMPLVLGKRLPAQILTTLTASLRPGGPFLTDWGLATESPRSPLYQPDGYWRGPIWAPPTLLIFDGLLDAGYTGLAREIAERFCDLCLEHPGFWENYDALTGAGLRCPGYTWTASVFLELAEWLATQTAE